jgi:hypothetical protein
VRVLAENSFPNRRSFTNFRRPSQFEKYVQACMDNNGGVIDNDEDAVKQRLSSAIRRNVGTFSDPTKATDDLSTFANLNEGRLYKMLKTCFDLSSDLKLLVKSMVCSYSSSGEICRLLCFLRQSSTNASHLPLPRWCLRSPILLDAGLHGS